jgi:hypothetical protein
VHYVARISIRLFVVAAIVFAIVALVAFVWPTLYRYDHLSTEGSTYPVRINRINGDADMLVPDEGWVPVEGEANSPNQENATATTSH